MALGEGTPPGATLILQERATEFARQADTLTEELRDIFETLGVNTFEEALQAIEVLQLDVGLARAVAHQWYEEPFNQEAVNDRVKVWAEASGA